MPTSPDSLRPAQRLALGMVALWLFGCLLAPTLHAAGHARGGKHHHDALGITHADHGDHGVAGASDGAAPTLGARPSSHGLGHTPVALLVPAPALPPVLTAPWLELPIPTRTDDAPAWGCSSTFLARGPPA